jgi:hypothetical protein
MQLHKILAGVLLAGWIAAAQTGDSTSAPQPGWTPAPRQGAASGVSEAQIAKMVEDYRKTWQKMKPAQQKRTLQMGGMSPEQYERMLRGSLLSAGAGGAQAAADKSAAPDYHRGPDANALDSLGQSLIDLNAIRDANVDRVQKDGCPPEVTSRIAELRGKIARLEGGGNGTDSAPQAAAASRRTTGGNPLDAAANWYKGDDRAEAAGAAGPNTDQLLDSVLPSSEASRPKLAGAGARRKAQEENVAAMKAELGQLLSTCVAVKQ